MSKAPQCVVVFCGTCLVLAPQIVHAVIEANNLFAQGIAARNGAAIASPALVAHSLPEWMLVTSVAIGGAMIAVGVAAMLLGSRTRG